MVDTQPRCWNSRVLVAGSTKLKDRQSSHLIKITASIIMTSLIYVSTIDGTDRRGNRVSNFTGLVSSQVREAGSGQRSKLPKHLTKFRAATWNVGSLKKHNNEVAETLN